jgi:Dolichyl-phosphate-mannose-protein mannosyltransferase
MALIVAFTVAVVLNTTVVFLLQRRYDPGISGLVVKTYLATLALRYLLAVILWLHHENYQFAMMFWGDSGTYDALGATVAQGWSQGTTFHSWTSTLEGRANLGFIYFVAVIYYLFGQNTLLVQFINGIIGALVPIVIFEIGLLLYDRKVATRAMLFTAFFPQMLFWSSALYKDAAVMLCISVNILMTLRMKRRFSPLDLGVYLATAGALVFLRFYIFYTVVVSTVVGFLVGQRRGLVVGLLSQIVLVLGIIVLLLSTSVGQEMLQQSRFLDLEKLQMSRDDLARSAETGFATNADVSTLSGLVRFLPVGIAYLLFSPFPWTVSSLRQLLAMPDVLVWYALVPSLIRGLGSAVRHRLAQAMPILLFTTALTVAYGAFLGNAGTAYRQRTQIMMFYFLFVADGMYQKRRRSEQAVEEWELAATR